LIADLESSNQLFTELLLIEHKINVQHKVLLVLLNACQQAEYCPSHTELAEALGLSPRQVRYTLEALQAAGLLDWRRTGRGNEYFIPGDEAGDEQFDNRVPVELVEEIGTLGAISEESSNAQGTQIAQQHGIDSQRTTTTSLKASSKLRNGQSNSQSKYREASGETSTTTGIRGQGTTDRLCGPRASGAGCHPGATQTPPDESPDAAPIRALIVNAIGGPIGHARQHVPGEVLQAGLALGLSAVLILQWLEEFIAAKREKNYPMQPGLFVDAANTDLRVWAWINRKLVEAVRRQEEEQRRATQTEGPKCHYCDGTGWRWYGIGEHSHQRPCTCRE
jgi:hypothetical protein